MLQDSLVIKTIIAYVKLIDIEQIITALTFVIFHINAHPNNKLH
nr:hypothetical protein [Mycoplasmopsis bovis]